MSSTSQETDRSARRWWRSLCTVIGWTLLAVVATTLALRWRDLGRPITIALVGLTPFLAVPVLGALLFTSLSRSRVLAVSTAMITIAFVVIVSPLDAVMGCRAEPAADDAITVYSANVLFDGGRAEEIATSIIGNEADIVLLQEARWELLDGLRDDARMAAFAHRSDGTDGASSGTVIWSRWPLGDVREEPFVSSTRVSATVQTPRGPIDVSSIHTIAPARLGHVWAWRNQFQQLAAIDTDTPRILGGDFNATADHRPFRNLIDQGWTDVHDPKGCGVDATWPVGRALPIPVLRLDHILVTDDFEVLDTRLADPGGSDHLPVVTELRLTGHRIDSRPVES